MRDENDGEPGEGVRGEGPGGARADAHGGGGGGIGASIESAHRNPISSDTVVGSFGIRRVTEYSRRTERHEPPRVTLIVPVAGPVGWTYANGSR